MQTWLSRTAAAALLLTSLWCAGRQLTYAADLAAFPYQLFSAEAAHLRGTEALARGLDPWAPALAAEDFNAYGVLNSWVAAKLLPEGRRGLTEHRLLALLALALSALAVAALVLRASGSWSAAVAAGTAAFGPLLFSTTPSAGCNGLATLAFTGCVALAAWQPDRQGALAASLLAVLGYFAKPYVLLGVPCACVALWVRGRRRDAVQVAAVSAALFVVLAAAAEAAWPGYLEGTVRITSQPFVPSLGYAFKQMGVLALSVGWPWMLLGAWGLWRRRDPGEAAPLVAMAALTALVLALFLGTNQGAYVYYHFQLLQPLGLAAAAALWGRELPRRPLALALLGAAAYLSTVNGLVQWPRVRHADLAAWRRAETLIAGAKLPYVPAPLASVASALGKPLVDNGMTENLVYAPAGGRVDLRSALEAHHRLWDRRLAEGRCDVVFWREDWSLGAEAARHYRFQERLCLTPPLDMVDKLCYAVLVPRRAD